MKLTALFQRLLFLFVISSSVFFHDVRAIASSESELLCSPLEIEPHQKSFCLINVRDSQQEPTMAFEVGEFLVTPQSSVPQAALKLSPLQRGDDVTTLTFDVSASEGTSITVNVMYISGNQSLPIRDSGVVVSVLNWPAVRMGPISCNVPSSGLVLRSTTTCGAALYDASNRPAALHKSDVTFLEENNLGIFKFISGMRELVFNFTAVSFPSMMVAYFTIHLTLKGSKDVYSSNFPLLYPDLYPAASFSTLSCSNETTPIVCTLRALDEAGPVRINMDYFRIVFDMLDNDVERGKWVDNTNAFEVYARSWAQADTVIFSWKLKVNSFINPVRLHVYIVSSASGNGEKSAEEVRGSPFLFVSGVMPHAAYVSLRGCRVSSITSGNRTQCFIDLHNGVTGDVRYFNLSSTLGAVFENITYLPMGPIYKTPVVSFVYLAPVMNTRSEDFITLIVGGQNAIRSPFHMNVFPRRSSTKNGDSETVRGSNALVIGVGLAFFGVIIGTGSFIALRSTLRLNRARQLRAMQKAQMVEMEEEAECSAAGKVGIEPVPQPRNPQESESD
ncbi:hypothetical protein MOQ_003657 [Trypanosoma cruzi marinkellei]|uniref:Transmembrane protein n=1 Tax=Trypanosoma cruzi marinkellei TaxID=85056 RepID=K2NCA1_TRYCR|nr:hypothetical protein MOQ_003657 [Trypanosoma cruzi marinkellei]